MATINPAQIGPTAKSMAGDLTVDSVYGQGSTFTVRVPSVVTELSASPT